MKTKLLEDLQVLRREDVYLTQEIETKCKDHFFPAGVNELTLDLSNVTSAFYGLALKNIGEEYGVQGIKKISEKVFYDLGRLKAIQCKSKLEDFPADTTALALVVISAIYNASPEYTFEILTFSPNETSIKLTGVDRYLRVLSQLELDSYIDFPVLIPFFEGIRDELNLTCTIDFESDMNKEENKTNTTYKFAI
ncbi:hypothetical protein N6B72_02535 [Chryseobacterium soli]|uniref:hypothetical protein n=1 Tax=Chryseobacterium soli TaxID=445961 RepID=UPI000690BBD0|nr:hypothetical protein [Chryseobacterium soli]MDV7695788.1 hypothetical protein [Chryseobacterium soli]